MDRFDYDVYKVLELVKEIKDGLGEKISRQGRGYLKFLREDLKALKYSCDNICKHLSRPESTISAEVEEDDSPSKVYVNISGDEAVVVGNEIPRLESGDYVIRLPSPPMPTKVLDNSTELLSFAVYDIVNDFTSPALSGFFVQPIVYMVMRCYFSKRKKN